MHVEINLDQAENEAVDLNIDDFGDKVRHEERLGLYLADPTGGNVILWATQKQLAAIAKTINEWLAEEARLEAEMDALAREMGLE